MPKYILNEANTSINHAEEHPTLLTFLTNTLMQSDFSAIELFKSNEDPVTQPYYRIYRADSPEQVINAVFLS